MAQNILKRLLSFLRGTPAFMTFPMSLLLIGLEELTEKLYFTCPCKVELNTRNTVAIFLGPALFILTLVFYFLRPFKHEYNFCSRGANDHSKQNCPKALVFCLIPPATWVVILLLDGDYVVCAMTDWKGVHVFDNELKRNWCKPTESIQNEKELQERTRHFIYQSQYAGYVFISFFSCLVIVFVTIYDCCMSGKCKCCPKQLISCCGPREETELRVTPSSQREVERILIPRPIW